MRKWGLTIEYSLNNIIRKNGEPGGWEYREIQCDTFQEAESALKDFAKECEDSFTKQNIPFFRKKIIGAKVWTLKVCTSS